MSLLENKAYSDVRNCYESVGKKLKLVDLFASDPHRFDKFSRTINTPDGPILIDLSKNIINEDVFKKLLDIVR